MRNFLMFVCLSAIAISAQAGQIYKWRDDSGTLHFSKIPPQDENLIIETIQLKPMNTMKPTPVGQPIRIYKNEDSGEEVKEKKVSPTQADRPAE